MTTGDGGYIPEIKTITIIEVPRAPRIQDLRGVDMQWWEEVIARYRADKKYDKYDINNYYAELKGVEDEIKAALERGSRGAIEGEPSTTKPDGAG